MGRISALTELSTLASDDYLLVLDTSANIAKKITVANAFGIQEFGWTATGETWTYSAWSSTTRIAEITVPTDATTKYYPGMRVKFTQPTDGTKFGIIMKVEATKLHVHMHSSYDFDNEAITTPQYSIAYEPVGFDLDPSKWERKYTSNSQVNLGAIASAATITNATGHSLQLGVGSWDLSMKAYGQITHAGTTYLNQILGLSTSNNSWSDAELKSQGMMINSSLSQTDGTQHVRKRVNLTSTTTYYLNSQAAQANTTQYVNGTTATTVIRAYNAYI